MPVIDTPITANANTLERVLSTPLPKLLLFYSHQLAPEIEQTIKQIARQEVDKLLVIKVDQAENAPVIQRYNLPKDKLTLLTWQNGSESARQENPTTEAIQQYTHYLLGRGAKPEVKTPKTSSNTPAHPITVTDRTFDETVLHSAKPVLVDFWAAWCGPCRMIAPALEKLAGEFAGRVTIAKLNVDENQETSNYYRVQGIPMLLMFKHGKVVDKIVGAAPEPMLREFMQKHS